MLKKENYRIIANEIFKSHTKYEIWQIVKSNLIHSGYTNVSYHFVLDDNTQYQVRIGKANSIVDRENEALFLNAIENKDFIYLNTKNGEALKKWVPGETLTWKQGSKLFFINKIYNKIQKLHAKPVNEKVLKHDFFSFLEKTPLTKEIKEKYLSLLVQYKDEPLVMSHNDLNPDNILLLPNTFVYFIDFEWARLNHPMWDIANYLREVNLSLKKVHWFCFLHHINFKKMKDYLFITTCYAYQWTFYMEQTEKILDYQNRLKSQMEFYFKKFF